MMSTMEEEPILDIQNDIEDGELTDSDAGEVEYTPLTRPDNLVPHLNPCSIMNMKIGDDISDESEEEPSSDDSDSDNPTLLRPKKPKIKIKHRKRAGSMQTDKTDKYKIWCKTAGEDTLTEDLIGCDVARNRTCYGVESYSTAKRYHNYNEFSNGKLSDKDNSDERDGMTDRLGNKRNNRDRKNVKLRLGRRVSVNLDTDHERGEGRNISDLIIGIDSPDEEVAKDIAEKLREPKDNLILRVVINAGREKAIEIFKETKRIEEDGGMLIMNGLRRRTPGGVYFFLLKRDKAVSRNMLKEIFAEQTKLDNRRKKKDQAKHRDKEVEQLKQSLNDSVLPVIRTRAEQWLSCTQETAEDTSHVSNPPPSPVTDGRDCSSDADTTHFSTRSRTVENVAENLENLLNSEIAPHPPQNQLTSGIPPDPRAANSTSYDEDYLDIMCNDDMDLF